MVCIFITCVIQERPHIPTIKSKRDGGAQQGAQRTQTYKLKQQLFFNANYAEIVNQVNRALLKNNESQGVTK